MYSRSISAWVHFSLNCSWRKSVQQKKTFNWDRRKLDNAIMIKMATIHQDDIQILEECTWQWLARKMRTSHCTQSNLFFSFYLLIERSSKLRIWSSLMPLDAEGRVREVGLDSVPCWSLCTFAAWRTPFAPNRFARLSPCSPDVGLLLEMGNVAFLEELLGLAMFVLSTSLCWDLWKKLEVCWQIQFENGHKNKQFDVQIHIQTHGQNNSSTTIITKKIIVYRTRRVWSKNTDDNTISLEVVTSCEFLCLVWSPEAKAFRLEMASTAPDSLSRSSFPTKLHDRLMNQHLN